MTMIPDQVLAPTVDNRLPWLRRVEPLHRRGPTLPSEWGARPMTKNAVRTPGPPITVCALIPVRARIAWNTNKQLVDCVATAWTGHCVRVEILLWAILGSNQ